MFYIVFTEYDRKRTPTDYVVPAPACRYVGRSKDAALLAFKDYVDFAFSTSSNFAGHTYFAGFDADSSFINTFEKKDVKNPNDVTQSDIMLFKDKLNMAICAHVLNHSCHKFNTSRTVARCTECDTETVLYKTASGHYLCEDCWNYYLTTLHGQVEYVIGLASGEYKISAFSVRDRMSIASAWKRYKKDLNKTEEELLAIEKAAEAAGLDLSEQQ